MKLSRLGPWRVFLAALFALCAVLQLNDRDPWSWFGVYGAAALASVLLGRRPSAAGWLAVVTAGVAIVWIALLAPSAFVGLEPLDLFREMKAETPAIEASREVLGLGLVAGWMVVVAVAARRSDRGGPD